MVTRLRWWPAALVVAGWLAWLAYVWSVFPGIRQDRILRSIMGVGLSGILLLAWFLLASGLRWKTRLLGLGFVVAVVSLGVALFRIEGVSGDLMPILAFRWSVRPGSTSTPPVVVSAESSAPSPGAPSALPPTKDDSGTTPAAAPTTGAMVVPGSEAVPSAVAATASAVSSADYPQFLGPTRDGVLPGPRLARDWSARPPRLLWRQPIGAAWSAFAVAGDVAVTQEQHGDDEQVVAYDARNGRVLWRHSDKARYDTVIAGVGPRATPTVRDGRVFAMGAMGTLNVLRLDTGARLWSRRILEENGSSNLDWGTSGSPLVDGDRVVVNAGGKAGRSLVAYATETGEPLWAAGHDRQSFSSPTIATLGGRRQILTFNGPSVAGHDAATGALLWEQPWPKEQPNVAQPLPLEGGRVLFSAGYGVGSKLYAITGARDESVAATLVWESPRLKSKFANMFVHDGFVYGFDDGVFSCLDPKDGQRKWRAGRYGHGQAILVGGLFLIQTEEGGVVLVDPSPDGLKELTRFTAFDAKTWNPPALAGNRLYVRNDRAAAAFELPVE
jgi:outer membrane protein assembly factor BamB